MGRDPGSQETAAGKPFIGDSGRLLFGGFDTLAGKYIEGATHLAGLTRAQVNITNRVLRQPYGNDFFKHNRADVEDGKRQLFKLIEELNPSVIIAHGNEAAYDLVPNWATLTDRNPGEYSGGRTIFEAKDVLDRRGFFWYDHDLPTDAPVLVTLHPAACLYQPMPNRLLLDIDFSRLGAHLNGSLVRRAWPKVQRIYRASDMGPIWDSPLVAYDIETTWGGEKLLCVGFFTAEGMGYLAYDDAIGACKDWLRSERRKVTQNGQFDRYFLDVRCGIHVGGRHEDTIIGHWACYPELAGKADTGREDQKKKTGFTMTRKGLNFLASFHLDVEWWKTYTSDRGKMGQLCVNDVAATHWVWQVQEPEIEAMGVRFQYERQMSKIPALIKIQKRGFLIDEALRVERIKALETRGHALTKTAQDFAQTYVIQHALKFQPNGKPYWWYCEKRCTCCGGGKKRAVNCDRCAGVKGSKKQDLIGPLMKLGHDRDALLLLKKGALVSLLPPCRVCGGKAKLPHWEFNIMSPTQMASLLFDHLQVPKACSPNGESGADDEILGRVLMWAKEGVENE